MDRKALTMELFFVMLVPLSVIACTLLLDRRAERLHRSLGGEGVDHSEKHV
jgi:hypothetical protein